jgi:hypothetical protein
MTRQICPYGADLRRLPTTDPRASTTATGTSIGPNVPGCTRQIQHTYYSERGRRSVPASGKSGVADLVSAIADCGAASD